ncbi:MAG: iron complex transport system substrate-binding protein [Planctomycetota bacterium]|jgi:iron complex transport system substrate-binding protein
MSSSPRVVSLLPSATEMVAAVGMQSSLVGVSHECDYPEGVAGLPIMTRTTLRSLPSSADIDRDVRKLVTEVLAVYELEFDRLRDSKPDVIVTQDLCDVCAVSYDAVCAAARELGNPNIEIVNLHPKVLQDIWNDIARVGVALDRELNAEIVMADINKRVEDVRSRAAELEERPTVLTIEWLDPVMIGGTWMPELVEIAGGQPLVTSPGDHAPTLDLEQLRALSPDVVLFKPCGFELERTEQERHVIEELLSAMDDWPAIRDERVFIADGNAYFNRPGPRIADSLEILAACIHPEHFEDFGEHYADGFRRFKSAQEPTL